MKKFEKGQIVTLKELVGMRLFVERRHAFPDQVHEIKPLGKNRFEYVYNEMQRLVYDGDKPFRVVSQNDYFLYLYDE